MFSDKYDIRYYLDKKVGIEVTDEIFDIIDKDEEEYKKEKKNLEEYSRYTEQMEESAGNLSTCIEKIEVSLRNIESILLSASANKKISKKLYKEVMGEMDCIKEYINDVDEDR
jgi:N-acetyl-beta-hexosaminidase